MSTTAFKDSLSNPEINIRLRRWNSATSSSASFQTLPPYTSGNPLYQIDSKNPFVASEDAPSLSSAGDTERAFNADKVLQINANGKPIFSLPSPSKELEVGISEGEVERYRNVRPERRSGNCTLSNKAGEPVAQTSYRFGPGKPPVVKLFLSPEPEEFEITGKSLFSFTVEFTSPHFGSYVWRYAGRKEKKNFKHPSVKGKPNRLLVLERKGEGKERVQVARMIRNDETRTPGTSDCEGNGGRLEIIFGGANEEAFEALVISTCLAMLKKEIDRLRAGQMAFVASVVC